MSTHLDRKELKRPDTFLMKAKQVTDLVSKNSALFIAIVVVVFVIGTSAALYKKISFNREQAAFSEFYKIKKVINEKIRALDTPAEVKAAQNKKEAKPETPPKEPKIYDYYLITPEQTSKIEAFINQKKGTAAAYYAAIYLADNNVANKKMEQSIPLFQKAVELAPSTSLKAAALLSLAASQEFTNQGDKAIESLKSSLALGEKQFRAEALGALGRNYEAKGDKKSAIEQYDLLIKEYPNTEISKSAQSRKDTLH